MVAFLIILGLVFFVAAGVTLWFIDTEYTPIALFVAGFMLIVAGTFLASRHEADTCHRKGGEIRGTGHYYPITTIIMSGKTAIPITTMHEETACIIP